MLSTGLHFASESTPGSHKGKAVRRAIRDVGRASCFCRNARPTSIRSSRSSPSSKPCCERSEREATKLSPMPALRFSQYPPEECAAYIRNAGYA